jgi:hypothetical protein
MLAHAITDESPLSNQFMQEKDKQGQRKKLLNKE